MPRDYKVYLEDMLEAIEHIRLYTSGFSLKRFVADRKTLDAVVRNLEVIGEAAKNVPPDVRRQHPKVEWRKMAGLRDILIHEYFGIDVEIVWDIIRHKIPPLRKQIRAILR
ncbi:MAG TPA: DUF86 domain-containing protein [Elusimicrobia bacterium]|nr:DUF86 domain-containing protein [Elusimicrobiota bacterium]HBT61281.1 DUF86 domain-containing protein [Elusimicrobiota bacterium]